MVTIFYHVCALCLKLMEDISSSGQWLKPINRIVYF